jgi:hypothetical protein
MVREELPNNVLFRTHTRGTTIRHIEVMMIQSSIANRFTATFPIILRVTKKTAIENAVIV